MRDHHQRGLRRPRERDGCRGRFDGRIHGVTGLSGGEHTGSRGGRRHHAVRYGATTSGAVGDPIGKGTRARTTPDAEGEALTHDTGVRRHEQRALSDRRLLAPVSEQGGRTRQGEGRNESGSSTRGGEPAVEDITGVGGRSRQGDGRAQRAALRGHLRAALGVKGDGVGGSDVVEVVEADRGRGAGFGGSGSRTLRAGNDAAVVERRGARGDGRLDAEGQTRRSNHRLGSALGVARQARHGEGDENRNHHGVDADRQRGRARGVVPIGR